MFWRTSNRSSKATPRRIVLALEQIDLMKIVQGAFFVRGDEALPTSRPSVGGGDGYRGATPGEGSLRLPEGCRPHSRVPVRRIQG